MTKKAMTEKALDKKIETLRALLGQDKNSKLGLSKPKPPSSAERIENSLNSSKYSNESSTNQTGETITDSMQPEAKPSALPTATKTFTPRDFIHFKKHSNEQSMVLIKRFLSKHGKPKENSSELHALTNAISRIINIRKNKKLDK